MWRCMHQRIPTRGLTKKWQQGSGVCPVCNQREEDVVHALRDCPRISLLWRQFIPPEWRTEFFSGNGIEWIKTSLAMRGSLDGKPWPELFATACWKIWGWRNQLVYAEVQNLPFMAGKEITDHVTNYFLRWETE